MTEGKLMIMMSAGSGGAPAPRKLTSAELSVLSNGGLTGAAAAAVNNAVEMLTQQCMQAKGLVYYANIITAEEMTRPGPSVAGVPQAYFSLAAREADGYGMYTGTVRALAAPSGGQEADKNDQYVASLPQRVQDAYMMALQGPESSRVTVMLPGGVTATAPSGGCQGIAQGRIYGSVNDYVLALTGAGILNIILLNSVTADPAFGTVISRWSACMKKRGYDYDSPEKLWNTLAGQIAVAPTAEMRALEVKIAVADYECSAALELLPTVRALQEQHARQLGGTLLSNLISITQIEATALKNAESLHLNS
jgi:hypothetical protein